MKKLCLLGTIAVLVAVFATDSLAADWNFYGSARVETFYRDIDNSGAVEDTTNFSQSLQGNARIGAKVKVSDSLTGRFEYGASSGNANIRHLYGEWDFGQGKFLVGQTDSPLNLPFSNQVYDSDEDLNSYGNPYAGRQPMLQLTFGNFKVAAISPDIDTLGVTNATAEVKIPKIEASYQLNFDNSYLIFAGGYQTYDLNDPATSRTYDVDSYIGTVGGHITLGSAYFAANIYYAQNTGPYNLASAADDMPIVTGTTLIDNDSMGWIFLGGMKLNDTFSFEAGYGYTRAELDSSLYNKDDVQSYYLQSTITLTEGVFFVPEIGMVDHMKDKYGNEESEILYYGIKWQINF